MPSLWQRGGKAMFFLTQILRNKKLIAIIIISVFSLAVEAQAQDKAPLKEKKEKFGYSLGMDIAQGMKDLSIEIDADMVAKGIKDTYAGKPQLTDDEMRTILTDMTREVQNKQREKMKILGEKNKKEGEAFLKKNAQESGVVTLPSGIQYKVMKEGSGKTPKASDTVIVHYKGELLAGTEFDSSYKRNQPAEFAVNNVIPGWNEVLQKMKAGSRWLIFIPPNLAYGERGNGPIIGPNAVLIFDIELLAVK
jgi:FKBP-type peptidyl-prolyl cis-trans isomerase FklB